MGHWIPSIIGKIGLQPSKYRPQRPSTHFSCWQISQLQSFFSDMPMEKLWMPESWGWTLLDSGLYPTKTDLPPVPDDLLEVIRCNCSTDCGSARCSCQKHGLMWALTWNCMCQCKCIYHRWRRNQWWRVLSVSIDYGGMHLWLICNKFYAWNH